MQKPRTIYLAVKKNLGVIAIMLVIPALAMAAAPGADTAKTLYSDMKDWLTPVFTIAVAGSGLGLMFKILNAMWFVGALIGTILFFGAPQFVTWMRGLGGV